MAVVQVTNNAYEAGYLNADLSLTGSASTTVFTTGSHGSNTDPELWAVTFMVDLLTSANAGEVDLTIAAVTAAAAAFNGANSATYVEEVATTAGRVTVTITTLVTLAGTALTLACVNQIATAATAKAANTSAGSRTTSYAMWRVA